MKVFIEETNKKAAIRFEGTARQLLKRLKINPATVLVARNGKLISLEDKLSDSDDIKILEVFMGG
ncbi:MAG: MoaD/ThiS family protein [Nanoarchaeota archaeon]|nr:MoaD/ThiS family protein [Nanoarchaeota archaeon]